MGNFSVPDLRGFVVLFAVGLGSWRENYFMLQYVISPPPIPKVTRQRVEERMGMFSRQENLV